MTVLHLGFHYFVSSQMYRDITLNIIWFIIDITQIFTVHRDLTFSALASRKFLEKKEYISFLNFKLFKTIVLLCLFKFVIILR